MKEGVSMNALPSLMVLDFCDWLKNQMKKRYHYKYTDVFDLILNEDYRGQLFQFANKYLQKGNFSIRKLLHEFIDSEEFEDSIKHCHKFFIDEWDENLRIHAEEIQMIMHDYYHYAHGDRAFERFIKKLYNEEHNWQRQVERITAEQLVDSLDFYIKRNSDNPDFLNFMTGLKTELALEIDFLEWLVITKNKPINITKMPSTLFETLAEEYCKDVGRYSGDKKKLIKAFKQSDTVSLSEKLIAVLTSRQTRRMKSLGYIYDRYSNPKIPYRCFFLPLAVEADRFEDFIKKYWVDLDSVSADYLDIFYGEEDFGKSGYAIKENMHMTAKELSSNLPCLVFWSDNLQDAQSIDIKGLTNDEIFRLVSSIVDMIKRGKKLQTIIMEAMDMSKEFNKAHANAQRPITEITVHSNTGVVAGTIKGHSKVTVYSGEITNKSFEDDTKNAIEIINSFKDVDQNYREALKLLVREANEATQKNDAVAKSSCKDKFNGFMLGAGKATDKILTALANLATIAGFFGLGIIK